MERFDGVILFRLKRAWLEGQNINNHEVHFLVNYIENLRCGILDFSAC